MKFDLSHPVVVSWGYVVVAVAVALAANAVSTKWASHPSWMNPLLVPMLVLSPLVFITFGLAASKTGLALGSANVDSLLTVCSIMFGLVFFQEWKQLSAYQYAGLAVIIGGIFLTQIGKSAPIV